MLLNFRCTNFCSFKDEFNFSMKPGTVRERFEDNVINIKNKKVSKVAVIVGENAGGKTSFIRSLDFLKYYIQTDLNVAAIKDLFYLKKDDIPQEFEIDVIIDEKVYVYGIIIDNLSVVKEYLYIGNPNQKKEEYTNIFMSDREIINKDKKELRNKLFLNPNYVTNDIKKIFESQTTRKPGLTINLLNKLGIEIIGPFIDWINDKLVIKVPKDFALNVYKYLEKNNKDLEIINTIEFLEIFSLVDPSIKKVVVDEEDPFRETLIIRDIGNNEFSIKLKEDSTGVNDFFAWSVEIYKVIYEDATLFADELDKVLNSILATRLLNFVKTRAKKGQFIFSTHNVLHINTIDFMKEQIYFVNKELDSLSSTIYPLSSFKEYRYEKSNVYELYLKGLLGGVPND